MARVVRPTSGAVVIAESNAEQTLLRDAGHELVLLEGFYTVRDGLLLLPEEISEGGAHRVCRALEQAAISHQTARGRRQSFRLVKDE
jgi:hypothetical protein